MEKFKGYFLRGYVLGTTLMAIFAIILGAAILIPDQASKGNRKSIQAPMSQSTAEGYSTIVIDSCEYIEAFNRLAHKGNCKFCAERRREDISKFIERIRK